MASAKTVESSSGLETSYQPTSCRNTAFRYACLYLSMSDAETYSMHETATQLVTNIPKPM